MVDCIALPDPTNVDAYMAPIRQYLSLNCPAPDHVAPATGSNHDMSRPYTDATGTLHFPLHNQLGDNHCLHSISPRKQFLNTTWTWRNHEPTAYYYETHHLRFRCPENGGSADDLYSTITAPNIGRSEWEVTTNTYFPATCPIR